MRDVVVQFLIEDMGWMNWFRAVTFLALWMILLSQPTNTKLGRWTNWLFLFTCLSAGIVGYFTNFVTDGAKPSDVQTHRGWIILIGMNLFPFLASIAGIGVLIHTLRMTKVLVSREGVFGTLAQALPIVVSDNKGIIRHTTREFDKLVGVVHGSLVEKSVTVIVPERYRNDHDNYFNRYTILPCTREHLILCSSSRPGCIPNAPRPCRWCTWFPERYMR